jgi:hypothetical protein
MAASMSKWEPGRGKTIDRAMKQAYAVAEKEGAKPPFVVERIELHGENPFTHYLVFLGPGG